jgi:phosphate transport system permease protein
MRRSDPDTGGLRSSAVGGLRRLRAPWSDRRAARALGGVSLLIALGIIAMIVFVAQGAWPMISHQGLSWLGSGGDVDRQLENMLGTSGNPPSSAYYFRAWPLIYGTLLTTGFAVLLGLPLAILSSIFIVEFAPPSLRRVTIPVVRLLAAIPSVVYGLIGVLVLVPYVGNHVITAAERTSMQNRVELTGAGLAPAAVILTVMITPIMVALICEALITVPRAWREGAIALGLNPLRATLAVTLRAARPAIAAAVVLATARALGEAVMLSMVSGSRSFTPSLADGRTFLFEPLRTVAAAIIESAEGVGAPALHAAIYSLALLLLFSALALSVAGYLVKLPLRKYQVRA